LHQNHTFSFGCVTNISQTLEERLQKSEGAGVDRSVESENSFGFVLAKEK